MDRNLVADSVDGVIAWVRKQSAFTTVQEAKIVGQVNIVASDGTDEPRSPIAVSALD
jgi:hypothetical protein